MKKSTTAISFEFIKSLFVVLVLLTVSPFAQANSVKAWECGLVDSSEKYTPNPQLFPPGKREEPLGCSSKPIFRKWIRKISLDLMGLPKSTDELFHSACVSHDLCYRHGEATYEKSKVNCDDEFARNLNLLCNGIENNSDAKKSCLRLPGLYHLGVKIFAGRYYRGKKQKLKSLYCEYLPTGSASSKWPYFWAAVQTEGTPFWKMIQEKSGKNLLIRGIVHPIPNYQSLKQRILSFFMGVTTEAQLTELIQGVVLSPNGIATAEEAHGAFEAWAQVLETKWRVQRSK